VACPVSTDTNISYFSLGASLRRFLGEFMIRSDMMTSLRPDQARRPVAGYLQDRMVQELRRKTAERGVGRRGGGDVEAVRPRLVADPAAAQEIDVVGVVHEVFHRRRPG
jgi:hypothetical protein